MKLILSLLLLCSIVQTACTQNKNKTAVNPPYDPEKKVGVSCEGCEAIFESPIPFEKLNSTDTLPDFNEPGPKIEISGIVYQRDGKTPARDVIIYVYHTDQTGHYSKKGNETGWGQRHGYIRGWMKTDKNGFYRFYTLRPVPYPKTNIPAHIHITIKEPDKNEYWIDEFLFDEDPLLTEAERKKAENRGGNGILKMVAQPNGISHGTRHIVLGVNVPNYPFAGLAEITSDLAQIF